MTAGFRIRIIHGVLKPPLNRVGCRFFRQKLGSADAADIMKRTWTGVGARLSGVPVEHPLGPTVILYLAAATCSIEDALLARGLGAEESAKLIEELAWMVYRRMGALAWALTRARTSDDYRRMLLATRLFRRFPFSPPAYEFKDVDSQEGAVAFDCLRCPAAEYFAGQGQADLCVRTFCNLDFPLARTWHGELSRSGTLAAGTEKCDFRWRSVPTPNERSPETAVGAAGR